MLTRLLRPRLIVSHLLVLAVAVTCVLLGQWQLRRLDEVRTNNDRLDERLQQEPIELSSLLDGDVDVDELEFRRVTVTGTYRPDDEVLQRGRQHEQQQGFHVLTPLELGDGNVALVRRGWVPAPLSEPPVEEAAPPTGELRLEGILEKPVSQPTGFGPRDPEDGILERVFHADTARLDGQIPGTLFPMVVRLESSGDEDPAALPRPLDPPALPEGNHLSYALQWFSFAILAVVTYGAWLWTRHRRTSDDRPDSGPPDRRRGAAPAAADRDPGAPAPQR